MKISKVFTLILSVQFLLVGCDRAKQRTEVIDSKIESNLIAIADIHDITSDSFKAYFYKEQLNESVKKEDSVPQIKINSEITKILNRVKNKEVQKTLDTHLLSGLIAFAVLPGQVKIYKIVLGSEANEPLGLTRLEIKKMKTETVETNEISSGQEVNESKNNIRFVELASVKIDKTGILDNKRTKYYNEKMSILGLDERPFALSTHLILKDEPEAAGESL